MTSPAFPSLPLDPGGLSLRVTTAWHLVRELHAQNRISSLEGKALLEGLHELIPDQPKLASKKATDLIEGGMSAIADAVRIAGSQAQLAEHTGLSQQHISRMCRGEKSISAKTAVKIEAATSGRVSRSRLRPDYWPTSTTSSPDQEGRP